MLAVKRQFLLSLNNKQESRSNLNARRIQYTGTLLLGCYYGFSFAAGRPAPPNQEAGLGDFGDWPHGWQFHASRTRNVYFRQPATTRMGRIGLELFSPVLAKNQEGFGLKLLFVKHAIMPSHDIRE